MGCLHLLYRLRVTENPNFQCDMKYSDFWLFNVRLIVLLVKVDTSLKNAGLS